MQLDPTILKGISRMGYGKPFPIQERSIGPLLKGSDVIGQAKTGSGKTAAFSIPLLESVDPRVRMVQALVLAPTRELAVQITAEMRRIGEFTGAKVATTYGGQSINVQREALVHGVHVVVGTPGRVIDMIERRWLDLRAARFVVLDEADTMLDMGFIEDVEFILSTTPEHKQMALFSATMPFRITELARKYMNDPVKILADPDEPSVETLDQYYASVSQQDKLVLLTDLLQKERPSSAIIFCRTKYGAHRLAGDLDRRGFDAVPLHGNLSQHQRDHHMNVFRKGHVDLLVATDVASRGIDISQVAWVVNFDIPMDPLLYFHRVGRTARAGRAGKAISFVSREEHPDFARILKMTKAPINPLRPEDRTVVFQLAGGGGDRGGYRRGPRRGHRKFGRPAWKKYR
ncbi:MAG: DEAD/DEAH box helicase [Thaumarchaeota archaeon]|nr:DEAD/DEAH box helicase [Nitrososphaerota archaeon]